MNHLCPLAHTDQDGDIMCGMVPIPCLMWDCERWTYKKKPTPEDYGMERKNCKTPDWQYTGGTIEIPDGWFVYKVDLDCEHPYAVICQCGPFDETVNISIPKSLAYYLSTHFCGSKVMREQIEEDTRRSIRNVLGI